MSSLESCSDACAGAFACIESCFEENGWKQGGGELLPIYASVIIAVFLVFLSGIFSGLTLGLLSLDTLMLEILMDSGDDREKKYAQTIYPIRKKGNLLLCTLLLGNTATNSLLSILLADLTSGLIGLLVSTGSILVLGEITPQAICSRHGLMIGANTVWLVRLFLVLFFPVAWPMSKFLDWLLGREVGTVFSKDELKKLIQIHVMNPDAQIESGLTREDEKLLTGALEFKHKPVSSVMTTMDRIYMLEESRRLDFETLFEIYKNGFTRIPVYCGNRSNVVGILLAKDLILVDPEDEIEVKTVLTFTGSTVERIPDNAELHAVFSIFKSKYVHLLVAYDPEKSERVTGIITLEDILEELIQEEIVDETDVHVDVNDRTKRVDRNTRKEIANFLLSMDRKHGKRALSLEEAQAVTAYLLHNVREFEPFKTNPALLKALVRKSDVLDNSFVVNNASDNDIDADHSDSETSNCFNLYKKGETSSYFTLLLQGKIVAHVGAEELQTELGPWTMLGTNALTSDVYIPDFDAETVDSCRLVRIQRDNYRRAVKACQMEDVLGTKAALALIKETNGNN